MYFHTILQFIINITLQIRDYFDIFVFNSLRGSLSVNHLICTYIIAIILYQTSRYKLFASRNEKSKKRVVFKTPELAHKGFE